MNSFDKLESDINKKKMPLVDHLSELRSRLLASGVILILNGIISSIYIKQIIRFFQNLVPQVRFLQLAPGEYFFSSLKIILYVSLVATIPFLVYQIILFILPGLTKKERNIIVPLAIMSILLFGAGILFSYYALIPAALNFFLNYGSDIVEPIWSLDQYLDFIVILLISTGLAFQVPTVQVLLGLLNIVNVNQMISYWRYILLFSTVIGAILTPSVDPITQILLSLAVFSLYFFGVLILHTINKITI
uniref:Sec-independent translocase component C n=1 Tax=Porphyridium sordidum TaxID=28024 RepID=A0A1C9CDN8_PORSO|nr:Sec-independent translocase component C [Porphyridium sordidum]AOM66500.1 Sec-independent translocase component C [Porphyridium sordidum]